MYISIVSTNSWCKSFQYWLYLKLYLCLWHKYSCRNQWKNWFKSLHIASIVWRIFLFLSKCIYQSVNWRAQGSTELHKTFHLWATGSNVDRSLVTESHCHLMAVWWLKQNMAGGLIQIHWADACITQHTTTICSLLGSCSWETKE